jgi:hypothetical protein
MKAPAPRRMPFTTAEVEESLAGATLPGDLSRQKFIEAVQLRLSAQHALPLQSLESLKKWERIGTICDELNGALIDPVLLSVLGPARLKFTVQGRSIDPLDAAQVTNLFLGRLAVELGRAVGMAKVIRDGEFAKKNPRRFALFLIANLDRDISALGLKGIGDPQTARNAFDALDGDPSQYHKMRKEYVLALRATPPKSRRPKRRR